MDAFYASVETRDNPNLSGKPLIIGALPNERGVVATCSYAARKFGVKSGMNIKEAYSLCPEAIFLHPNFKKYEKVSENLHEIWSDYATLSEYVALDEAYLDITEKAKTWEGARKLATEIKSRVWTELNLTCSVGLGYSKTAAKTASEEKKPNGYFEILTSSDFVNLIIDRDVSVLYTVGPKSKQKLNSKNIYKVRDIINNPETVKNLFGKQGEWIVELANGNDFRKVTPRLPEDAKTIGREVTFQEDTSDFDFLEDVLLLLSVSVEKMAKNVGLYGKGVCLKITYSNMKSISKRQQTIPIDSAIDIFDTAKILLEKIEKKSVRLIGVSIYNLFSQSIRQISFDDIINEETNYREKNLKNELYKLQQKYDYNFSNIFTQNENRVPLHELIEYMRKSSIR